MSHTVPFVFAPPSKVVSIVLNPVPPIYEDPAHSPAQRFWWKHRGCCSTTQDLKILEGLPLKCFDEKESRKHPELPRGEEPEDLFNC